MSDTTNTQTEDEKKAAEAKAAEKEAAKAAKAAAAEEAKAKRVAEAAEKKAAKDAEVEAKKAEKEAAKAAKEAEKKAKKAELEAKKQAKIEAAAATKAEKEAAKQPEQNGVRRRAPGSKCGRIWEICDTLSAQLGQPTPVKNVLDIAQAEGLHPTTIRCQYAHWKKFNGLEGRITLPAAETAAA